MPPQNVDRYHRLLLQMADQHEEANNPVYFKWYRFHSDSAPALGRDQLRAAAAASMLKFKGEMPPETKQSAARAAAKQSSDNQDEDVPPPRSSPPDLAGEDEDAPVDRPQPSVEVRQPVSLDRIEQAMGATPAAPSQSAADAARVRSGFRKLPMPGAVNPPMEPDPRPQPQPSAPPAPPAPTPADPDALVRQMVENGMDPQAAAAAVRQKYPGVKFPSAPSAQSAGGQRAPQQAKGPSAGERDAAVRAMIEQTRRPGMSREDRANAIARAMLQNEINHLISRGYSPEDAAQMVDMKAIANAANRQLVSDEVQDGQRRGREEDAAARQRAVTATGPEARQMAAEDAVTLRIRNQNQNARTRGLGGQNRLWDENDPETRAMVAQQIAAEQKAATEKEIAATGLGTRRVPTPRGAGGEPARQGAAFASAQEAEDYNRRLPAQPALGEDGLPVGGKPGLFMPSERDRDMAARGYVPTYGPNGEIVYSIAAFTENPNAPPGAPGRAGDRRDLRFKGWQEEERLGPTGMQRVLVPGSEVQERMLRKRDGDLIERLRTRAGVSEEQLRALRKGADGEPGLNNTALIERLRMMGNDRKAEDLAARKANARSHAMLAGPNAARNAVNAFNMLPPDWQATVTAKALRPDLAGTTPNDAAVAAAQAVGRGGGVLERLEAMRMQMEQARLQHEERMFTLRNQGEPERQKVASAMEDKKINEQAVAAGAPVHVVRSLQSGDYFTPEVERWLVRMAAAADTYDLPAWLGGSGYAEGDAERFKASLSAAGVSDPAVQDQLWEHATKLRDAQSYLPWNPGS